jgi:hypothetical protein
MLNVVCNEFAATRQNAAMSRFSFLTKLFCGLFAVFLTAGYAQAQELKWGMRLAVGSTNIWGLKDGDGNKIDNESVFKLSSQMGVVVEYPINDAITLQSGLLYAKQGWRPEKEASAGKIKLRYFRIPVHAQYSLGSGSTGLIFNACPYVGIGLNGKWKTGVLAKAGSVAGGDFPDENMSIKFGSNDTPEENTMYLSNRIDVGMNLGVAYAFAGRFRIGLEYALGLTPMDKDMTAKGRGTTLTGVWMFGKK